MDKEIKIPDVLLTYNLPIIVAGCTKDKDSGSYWVIGKKQFKVIARPRPGSYEEEESASVVNDMLPFVTLRKFRKYNGNIKVPSRFIQIKCENLIPGVEYKIYLETRSRFKGNKTGRWRHPVNFDHPEAYKYGLGYASMRYHQRENKEKDFPKVPTWMPNNGYVQTEWKFMAEDTSYKIEIDVDELFYSLRKWDEDKESWTGLVGSSNSFSNSLVFRFTVFQAGGEYFTSHLRTSDILKIGFADQEALYLENDLPSLNYVSIQ